MEVHAAGPEEAGAALHALTGSRAHVAAVRREARRRGLRLDATGVWRRRRRVAGSREEEVFAAAGLAFVPPELREDRGEVEAARADALPELLRPEHILGDLHCHTRASDGLDTAVDMARAAAAAGLRYLAITEHSERLRVARGLAPAALLRHLETLQAARKAVPEVEILAGVEVEILESGALDLPDEVLGRMDVVVGAVHTALHLPRRRQTRRILRAIESGGIDVLAHPTARLLGRRAGLELDLPRVVRAAAEADCALELNANPRRLDLPAEVCRRARDAGVFLAISADAHAAGHFARLRYGVEQARRGWLRARDVLNTRPPEALRAWLRRRRRAANGRG